MLAKSGQFVHHKTDYKTVHTVNEILISIFSPVSLAKIWKGSILVRSVLG